VTTSAFSAQAIDFAARIPQRVVPIIGKRLTELMVEQGVGVRTSRTVEFKRLDEDFFFGGVIGAAGRTKVFIPEVRISGKWYSM